MASGELTDEELTGVALLLLVAGHETTANMLALGTFALLANPDQLAALRADPALIEQRRRGAAALPDHRPHRPDPGRPGGRRARRPLDQEPASPSSCSLPAANRDPRRFADPDPLDITRQATGHLAFGHGVHQCLGQQLARVEMRIAYAALLRRFPGLRLAVPPRRCRCAPT